MQAKAQKRTEPVRLTLETFLPYKLNRLSNAYTLSASRLLRSNYGIGIREWRVLGCLSATGPLPVTEIAERTAMEKARVSRSVGSLSKRGLVSRAGGTGAQRNSPIELTDQGQDLLQEMIPRMQAWADSFVSVLSNEERASLSAILDKLQHRMWQISAGLDP